MPRPHLLNMKRKGRYVLLSLALLGLYHWPREPKAEAQKAPAPVVVQAQAPQPACAPSVPGAPAPTPPAALSGRLGLWVAKVDPQTLQPLRVVTRDPEGVYPLASSYKQAVLWALMRAIDGGRVTLGEKFSVTHANQSLGNYPFDGSDVRTLAGRMIHNSDNTATDILHRRLGLGAVQAVADDLKLCHTRLILPTKDWWVAQSGADPQWPGAQAFAGASGEARERLASALDQAAQDVRADALQVKLDHYFEEHYDPQNDLGTHNVSTPAEFGTLITHEFLEPGLSPPSRALQREIMATGFGRNQLHAPLVYFGGKGGNGWKILTMTGYFETPGGDHVVYVLMQHGSHEDYTIPNIHAAFRWINAAVGEVLQGQPTVARGRP